MILYSCDIKLIELLEGVIKFGWLKIFNTLHITIISKN